MYEENAYLKLLQEISELISDVRRVLKNTELSRNPTAVVALIRSFREDLSAKMEKRAFVFSDRNIFPSKEAIVDFIRDFYNEYIPLRLRREEIEKEAVAISRSHESASAQWRKILIFLEKKSEKKLVDVFSMSPSDIEKTFSNTTKYPDVLAIKRALPKSFRSLLKDVRRRETAIRKIIAEVDRIKSVHKIYDIFSESEES